jgi:predicted alpha/beta hydrolase family esterase
VTAHPLDQDARRPRRAFLVLHGWQNHRPAGHWHRRLVAALRAQGEPVAYPALPDADDPDLDAWLAALHAELDLLADLGPDLERIVVAHSLGATLWLHATQRDPAPRADRVLLVAPPGPSALVAHIPAFVLPDPLDTTRVHAAAAETLLVTSDADPWCVEGGAAAYADPLGLAHHVVPRGGHLALDDGYGPWDAPIRWCRDPAAGWPGN